MQRYLPLPNPNKFLADIADTIKEIYPIGIDPLSAEYNAYPGIVKMNSILAKNVDDNENFNASWKRFLIKLTDGIKGKIANTCNPLNRAFSAEVILDRYEDDTLIRVKKITFSVSFISPYFAINGVDETFIKESDGLRSYRAINIITISPYNEFEKDFNYLRTEIEKEYPQHHFLSYKIGSIYLQGLITNFSYPEECTIHNALFDDTLNDYKKVSFRGNTSYGIEPAGISISIRPLN
ncbi:hypothetical protein [Mucilaginibacter boryungensis]|uniref:Uncharacterized protein n=1 Tax=Mucilaginibacter boryungensis TaxID=768480 RepID=A0ABR9XEZ5_9SPHI|nr:hypothetical protein [Mucilaginibacter boryungensis]MBE9665957.1 hypothetical protein [Mucilaginibacter boryungensis]